MHPFWLCQSPKIISILSYWWPPLAVCINWNSHIHENLLRSKKIHNHFRFFMASALDKPFAIRLFHSIMSSIKYRHQVSFHRIQFTERNEIGVNNVWLALDEFFDVIKSNYSDSSKFQINQFHIRHVQLSVKTAMKRISRWPTKTTSFYTQWTATPVKLVMLSWKKVTLFHGFWPILLEPSGNFSRNTLLNLGRKEANRTYVSFL